MNFLGKPIIHTKKRMTGKRTDVNFCSYKFVGLMEELREFPMRILILFWGQGLG